MAKKDAVQEERNPNLAAWESFCRPPKTALKQIRGGRLSGMTDINPTWRMKAMTEVYGPCGTGWWYTIDSFEKHDMAGEIALMCRVTLHVKGVEHGVPGIGGSMLQAQEKGGLRLSDEAWKMATTDALSVAMKALGVGAEIYMGNFDGSKYRTESMTIEDKIMAADVRPMAGVTDDVPDATMNLLADMSIVIKDHLSAGNKYEVHEILTSAKLDTECSLALWTMFDSAQKRAIKEIQAEYRKLEHEDVPQ